MTVPKTGFTRRKSARGAPQPLLSSSSVGTLTNDVDFGTDSGRYQWPQQADNEQSYRHETLSKEINELADDVDLEEVPNPPVHKQHGRRLRNMSLPSPSVPSHPPVTKEAEDGLLEALKGIERPWKKQRGREQQLDPPTDSQDEDDPIVVKARAKSRKVKAKPKPKAVPGRKGKKKQDSSSESEADPSNHKLVLMVPRLNTEGTQRIILAHNTSFIEALKTIHMTVGCVDVAVKPTLAYKLSTMTAKEPPVSLASQMDWEGCLDDVLEAEKGGKRSVKVTIIIGPDRYLESLRAKLGTKSTTTVGNKKRKGLLLLDLDHAGSGDDDFDEGLGSMDREHKFLEQLQNKHGHCQVCGPGKLCKIDAFGRHHILSNGQQGAWAHALAVNTHGVTLDTLPRNDMFAMFRKSARTPYGFVPWGMGTPSAMPITPGTPAHNGTPWTSSRSTRDTLLSSDPPEFEAANPYPELAEFLERLHSKHPRRRPSDYIITFDAMNVYHIDEILSFWTVEKLEQKMDMTHGNASFLWEQVTAEIKRVKRARRG
ncbi:unnamed protein product [Mycena citricolor]|uniref:Uncharacterized protein n=1 Tax=Mycena citricolor TaxID=2018698 RepID=A0AAD2HQ21_9AGAR|nr:unnamed protein product [Mycena citricolor]